MCIILFLLFLSLSRSVHTLSGTDVAIFVKLFLLLSPFQHNFSVAFRDTPRKRGGALTGSSGPGRSAPPPSSLSGEPQPDEVVDENFPVSRPTGSMLINL